MPLNRQVSTHAIGRQQEKSEATRNRICAGAVKCLSRLGYHRSSIKRVVDAAGVSQGALQHHFPSKEELMEATAEYLLTRSVKWFVRTKNVLETNKEAFAELIGRSWVEQFRTPEYGALLEILTAARTDKALRKRIAPKLNEWRTAIEEELSELLTPIARDSEDLAKILAVGRCMMTGLLVHDGLIDNNEYMEGIIHHWTAMVSR